MNTATRWLWRLYVAALAALAALAFAGCSAGRPDVLGAACGPAALATLYARDGAAATPRDVAGEIVAASPAGNGVRELLAAFDPEAREITFPGEVVGNLRRHGYAVRREHGGRLVESGLPGVALIRYRHPGKGWTLHYVATPVRGDDARYFGPHEGKAIRGWRVERHR